MRDLIVVLPGIMGSTLEKDGKLVWAPSAGAVLGAITSFGRSLQALTLPDRIGDDHPDDGVRSVDLMPDLHILPGIWTANIGYEALLHWLRSKFDLIEAPLDDPDRSANLLPVAYDWRLSNRYNGRRLKSIVEPALEKWQSQGGDCADAKLVFVCHSMGGLVARWYIEQEGGAEITRKLITLGTPHRGSLKALAQLVNGVRLGPGPFALNLTRFARSLPSLHQLLPEYACIESGDDLLKISETAIPDLATDKLDDAVSFHEQLDMRNLQEVALHPVVGFRQTTATTAAIQDGRVQPSNTIDGIDEGGDGIVPRLAAIPRDMKPDAPSIRSAADRHGSLPSNRGILDEIEFVLGARAAPHKAAEGTGIAVDVEDVVLEGRPIVISATTGERDRLRVTARDEAGVERASACIGSSGTVELGPLPPGGYAISVEGVGSARTRISPVTCPVLVWASEES